MTAISRIECTNSISPTAIGDPGRSTGRTRRPPASRSTRQTSATSGSPTAGPTASTSMPRPQVSAAAANPRRVALLWGQATATRRAWSSLVAPGQKRLTKSSGSGSLAPRAADEGRGVTADSSSEAFTFPGAVTGSIDRCRIPTGVASPYLAQYRCSPEHGHGSNKLDPVPASQQGRCPSCHRQPGQRLIDDRPWWASNARALLPRL